MIQDLQDTSPPDVEQAGEKTAVPGQWGRQAYWSLGSVSAATIQGLCLFAVVVGPIRALLGITSVAAASGFSFLHSDPIRLPLRYVSVLLALITFYLTWNGWRLARRPAARWRVRPQSKQEKRNTQIGFVSSIVSMLLIVAEMWLHKVMHP